MEGVLEDDGLLYLTIDNVVIQLPQNIHETYSFVIASKLGYQHHNIPHHGI